MGTVHRFGDNIDTDAIIPARYLVTTDPAELAEHCMEGSEDLDFVRKVKPGDFIVAGSNFGCGSSREQAPVAIKGSGVACVIAKSYSRIFLRNSINIGLAVLECPEASEALKAGEGIKVDPESGTITADGGRIFKARPLPAFMMEIVKAGGLMAYVTARLKRKA